MTYDRPGVYIEYSHNRGDISRYTQVYEQLLNKRGQWEWKKLGDYRWPLFPQDKGRSMFFTVSNRERGSGTLAWLPGAKTIYVEPSGLHTLRGSRGLGTKTGTYIDSDGSELTIERWSGETRYFNSKGQYHRLDGPAKVWESGHKHWYQDGELHRLNGPAMESPSGNREWWAHHKRHRLDGPAYEGANGERHWYQDGQMHRLDGPAYEDAEGRKYWYVRSEPVEPLFLVAYWLEKGRCCWFDEEANELRFGDEG